MANKENRASSNSLVIRTMDFLFSFVGLVILSPLFILIAVLIRLDSVGPVFYRHERIGKGEIPFKMYKFRSMVEDASEIGPYFTAKGDSRITAFGSYLRKFSLDELPQLINVLKEEMSLVGPRPDVASQLEQYTEEQRRQRHTVRPGITGLAQINGRNQATFEERLENDLRWVRDRSMWLYISVLFQTVWLLVRSRSF